MIARKKGHLVALSSLASFCGLPKMAAYCASKAGLNAMFDALAIDLAPQNICVTTVCPGFIRTPMTAQFQHEFPGMMDLDYAVERILDAIRRQKRFAAFPARRAWMLQLLRSMPATWVDRLMRRRAERLIGNAELRRPAAEPR
jgi:short-subunit dehydrogenase